MKTRIALLLVAAVLASLVAACAPPAPEAVEATEEVAVETTEAPQPPPKIKMLMREDMVPTVEKAIELVKKEHPDWEITIDSPPEPETIFLASMAAGEGPDIYYTDTFMIPESVEAEYLLDLTPFVEKWPDWDQYLDSMKALGSYKGKVYAIVWDTDVRSLYYWKDHFEKAGIPVPWQPKSWADILDAARELKAAGVVDYPLLHHSGRNMGEGTSAQAFFPLLWGAGGELYDWEEGKWVVTSKALLDVLNYYRTIYEEGLGPPEMVTEPQALDVFYGRFAEGKSSIMHEGSWAWGPFFGGAAFEGLYEIPNKEEVLGLAVMPGKEGGFITASGGWSWAITTQAKNPEAAFEVLAAINSKEIVLDHLLAVSNVAPRMDVGEDPAYTADLFLAWAVKEVLPYAKFRPAIPPYAKISPEIQLMVERAASLEMTPEEALAKFAQAVEELVGPENVIREIEL